MSDIIVKKQATPTLLPDTGEVSIYISSTSNAIETVDEHGVVTTYTTPTSILTTEDVQDIVGQMTVDTNTITKTYNDPANTIEYHVDATGIDHTLLQNIGTNSHAQIDSHIASTSNPHSVTATQVGLGNVDNTSDLNKPVSTATQAALNTKENTLTAGTTSQYYRGDKTWQTLDKSSVGLGNVPNIDTTNPANITQDLNHRFVSDTEKTTWNNKQDFITVGTTSQYYRGDKTFQTLDKTVVGLSNVDNTSDLNKPISTATQTALNSKENTITSGTTAQFLRGDKTWHTLDTSYLTDFSVSSPQLDEVLKWNGVAWVNGNTTSTNAGAGVAYFFTATVADVTGYDYMQKTPDNATEVIESVSVDSTNSPLLVDPYISDVPFHKTSIDAGIWNFNLYSYVSAIQGTSSIYISVYSRETNGTETLLFTSPSASVTTTAVAKYQITTAQPSFSVNTTDRLVFKLYASHNSSSPVTIYFVHSGNTHYSYVDTPLILAHNDLGGLQGGTTGQQYHLTQAEYTGTGTGVFVKASGATLSSPIINTPTGITKSDVGLSNVPNLDTSNPANITQDTTHLFVTDTEKTAWNGKQDTITGGATSITSANLTVSRALTSDASGKVSVSTTTSTELGYLSGTTSSIQTQINSKEGVLTAGTTSQYYRGDKTWQTLDKSTVGLGNVDNTSDLNKPISSSTQTALNGKENSITAGTTSQYWRGDKTWQTLNSTSVGLGNVNNTSDSSKTITGDVSGTLGASSVDKLKGVPVSATAPSAGQVLTYNGTNWAPAASSGGGSSTPSYTINTTSAVVLSLTSGSNPYQLFNGSTPGMSISLPDATTGTAGVTYFRFVNNSSTIIPIKDFSGVFISTLYPNQQKEILLTDTSSSSGVWIVNIEAPTLAKQSVLFDDFISSGITSGTIGELPWTLIAGGGHTMSYVASTAVDNGILNIGTGTGILAGYAIHLGNTSTLVGGGPIIQEWRVRFPTLATATQDYNCYIGLNNTITFTAEIASGIYFTYNRATSTNWIIKTANASVRTATTTSVAVGANTWHKLQIAINSTGTQVDYYIDNVFVGSITTNIPTAVTLAPQYNIQKTVGATDISTHIDYFYGYKHMSVTR